MLIHILNYIQFIFQGIAVTYLFMTFTKFFYNEKIDNKKIILIFLLLSFYGFLSKFVHFPFNTLTFVLLSLLILRILFKLNILKSLLFSSIYIIISSIIESICVYAIISFFKKSPEDIYNSETLQILICFLYSFFIFISSYCIIKLIYKKVSIKNFFNELKFKHIRMFLTATIICVFPQLILFCLNKYNYPTSLLILNVIQTLSISIFISTFLNNSVNHEKTKNELKISEVHNKTMSSMIDGVRILKHDYNNIIQALSGYIATKQYDKLEAHIQSVMKECTNINNVSAITSETFTDPALYGVVGTKYLISADKDISFETDISSTIKFINFPMPEFSRILGILLDNAIEATSKIENKLVRLEMKYDSRKNADIIRVINTYDISNVIDFEQIYKKGFSTKKVKSGIGLWEVKKIVSKFKNSQIFPSIENDRFIQTIIVER